MLLRLREIAGWALVLFGLWLVSRALDHVAARQVVEGAVVVFASFFVFRGGIHLVKASTAARICLNTEASEQESKSAQSVTNLGSGT